MRSLSAWALRHSFALGSLALPILGVGCTGEIGDDLSLRLRVEGTEAGDC